MMDYTYDASCYLGAFQVCLQNLAYSEIFKSKIEARLPIDQSLMVIEDEPTKLAELLNYFENESNWGINNAKYEKEALERLSS